MLRRSVFISFITCFFIIARGQDKIQTKQNYISISVHYDKALTTDTLILKLSNGYGETQDDLIYQATQSADQKYLFRIPVNEAVGRFKIQKRKVIQDNTTPLAFESLTPVYLWERNDNVTIEIRERKQKYTYDFSPYATHCYSFAGKGYEKYFIKNRVDSIVYYMPDMGKPVVIGDLKYTEGFGEAKKTAIMELDIFKGKLSVNAYYIIKSDILYYNSIGSYNIAASFFKRMVASGDSAAVSGFTASYNSSVLNKADYLEIPEKYLAQSSNYLKYCLKKFNTAYFINHGIENADSLYYGIKTQFKGDLKENLIVAYFLNYHNSAGFDKLFKDASANISQPVLVDRLKKIGLRLPGIEAYDFSLSDTTGQLIRLSDFKGKIVIMDFWITGCGGCSHLYKNVLSKAKMTFDNDSSVVFISVSVDVNKAYWLKGIASGLYTSPQTINLYTSGKGTNDPFVKNYNISEYPTVILIDDNMKIVRYNTLELYRLELLIDQIKKIKQRDSGSYATKKERS